MKIGLYPGSFDPLTKGHLDIIERASKIVDKLYVSILVNSAKNPLFSINERVSMLTDITAYLPNVEITTFGGLTAEYANQIGATIIVRGLRAVSDFEYELQIAQTNRAINPNLDTIFLTTDVRYSYLSSTIVREVASYGGDLSKFVPESIIDKIYEKYKIEK